MNNLANKITAYLGSKPDFNEEVKLVDNSDGKGSREYLSSRAIY